MHRFWLLTALVLGTLMLPWQPASGAPTANTYYVSSATGLDTNPGTQELPFKSVARVNQLQSSLQPGDKVLFHCGDIWRAEMLTLTRSGSAGSPITYSAYPPGCSNPPVLSGTQPITGWAPWSGNIYVTDLSAGGNAALFTTAGINQLFRDGTRLRLGRWPNLDAADGGYATLEAQPDGTHLSDDQLPAGSWLGAVMHLKVIRWSMINRSITGQAGSTLTLNNAALCAFTTSCAGWGYFLNNSLTALDQDGEWFYDSATRQLYLYSLDPPSQHFFEGSVVPANSSANLGGVNLGAHLGQRVAYITVEQFILSGWYKHGIASPTNLTPDENAYITLQQNRIVDVDSDGINLWTWVYGSAADDWRGGNHMAILNNTISGANHFGIHTPSRETTVEGNLIRDVALIANLNASGMGCGLTGSEGTCTEDGAGLRIYYSGRGLSGYGYTIRFNRFERIGGNGIMNFGYGHTIQNNIFHENCYAKGDCGAINTYGGGSLADSPVHDLTIQGNLILDTQGNTDGTHPNFRPAFGFGLYIDRNSRSIIATDNVVAGSTSHGILYQDSTGVIQNNLVFNNATGNSWAAQAALSGSAQVSSFSGNLLVARVSQAFTLALVSASQIGSANANTYAHSKRPDQINLNGQSKTLAQWQALSGKDSASTGIHAPLVDDYFLIVNESAAAQIFSLGGWPTCDPTGSLVTPPLLLAPYSGRVLVRCGQPAHWYGLPQVSR